MLDAIFDEFFKALGYLMIAGVVSFAWIQARDNAKSLELKKVLWNGLLWCGGIALFASIMLGSPSCEVQGDPVYGGCEQYADDGYEPTTEERASRFAYFMTLLYIPVVIGAFNGNKHKERDSA